MKKNVVRFALLVVMVLGTFAFSAQPSKNALACGDECPACEDTDCPTPTPILGAPVCGFDVTPLQGSAPLTVTVTNTGTVGASIFWDFGDNTLGEIGESVTHTYLGSGDFQLTQRVFNPDGTFCWHAEIIKVAAALATTTATPTPIVPVSTPQPVVPFSWTTTTSGSSCTISDVDDSSIVICGDNNTVTIDNSSIQPTPAPTATIKPLSIWQKIVLPWKTMWRGIVTIIQGWFDLNVAP